MPETPPILTDEDARTLERCMRASGIVCMPTDTVYGLACDPDADEALERLWALKQRNPRKPSAVLFSRVDLALAATPWLDDDLAEAIGRLLPGPLTVVVPNPHRRFPLACGGQPEVLGLRVPRWPENAAVLEGLSWPLLQTSANHSGRPDPARMEDLDPALAAGCDLLLNAGPLPGTPSTVVDLTRYAAEGAWNVLREGAVDRRTLARQLDH
ncbi:MAG: L-threonylcarbamoyladenylate synthase [Solirubrobacteraceae bacterium]|nr:L-threonylcarbamoyladenylate synthase [Solirubrobacteraceae bacterium]